jgi:hypothetical protein
MTVEVKTKLTLDDNASSALGQIKQAFVGLHESSEQATEGFTVMKQVIAEFVTEAIHKGIEEIREFGGELVEAASHGQEVEQRLAGMATAVQGVPWADAKQQAVGFFEDIQDIAINTMQPIDDVEAGFNRLVEIQGATPQGLIKAREQIEQMSQVARVLGTSVEAIGGQFAFMEEGTLKVKSQMYQLLQPTGIFEHAGMKATEYWSKLTNDSRAELLAQGLEKLSSRMAVATPTFKDFSNQLDNAWDMVKEEFGGPIITALSPQLQKVTQLILGNSKSIERYAEVMGQHVGEWVDEASKAFQEGFAWIEDHSAEIADDIKAAWAFAKSVIDFAVQHKEALALGLGAKAIGGSELAKGAVGAIGGIAKLGSGGTAVAGLEMAGVAGGAAALGAFTLAIGASILALKEWDDLMKVTGGGKSDDQQSLDAVKARFQEMINSPDAQQWSAKQLEDFDKMRANLIRLSEAVGESTGAAAMLADQAWAAHHSIEAITGPLKAASDAFDGLAIQSGQLDSGGAVALFANSFNQAAQAHNEAAMNYIGQLLSGDAALQAAFLNSADLTAQGFGELAAHIGDSADDFKNKLMSLANGSSGKVKEMKPTINFGGGQTFKIQQDFRDQDPDKIAVVFRNDIFKSATQRIQAIGNTPFGT